MYTEVEDPEQQEIEGDQEEDGAGGWGDVEWEDNDIIPLPDNDADSYGINGGEDHAEGGGYGVTSTTNMLPSDRAIHEGGVIDIFLDGSAVNNTESSSSSSSKAYQSKTHVSYTEEDRRIAERIQASWTERRLCDIVAMNAAARDQEVVCVALSLVLSELASTSDGSIVGVSSIIDACIVWITANFRIIDDDMLTSDEGRDGSQHSSELLQVMSNRAGSVNQLNQVLMAILLAMDFNARFIATADPPSAKPGDHAWIKEEARSRKKDASADENITTTTSSSSSTIDLTQVKKQCGSGGDQDYPAMCWIEVLARKESKATGSKTAATGQAVEIDGSPTKSADNSKSPRTAPLATAASSSAGSSADIIEILDSEEEEDAGASPHPISSQHPLPSNYAWVCGHIKQRTMTNRPEALEALRAHKRAFVYVVAVNSLSVITDVTVRYAAYVPTDNAMKSKGYDRDSFRQQIANISTRKRPSESESAADADLTQRLNELRAKLPTNLTGFINHPYFVLEKQLQFDEVINPSKKKAVGVYKGTPVYPRSAVEKICPARVWRRLNRRIIEGEKPIKVRTIQRMTSSPSASSGQSLQKVSIPMYASWQTELVIRDVVNNGVLPVNEYGNIEIMDYNTSNVPIGSTYVQDECALQAAVKLGLPHAPAVVGFESKKSRMGKSHPIIDGVVVLSEHAALVREVATQLLSTKMDAQSKRLESKCASRWEKLTRGLLARQYVQDTYGGAPQPSATK